MVWLDTIIRFNTPVRVSYESINLVPFQEIPDSQIEDTGRMGGDFPLPQVPLYAIKVPAELLLVRTLNAGNNVSYSGVERVHLFEPRVKMETSPCWDVQEFSPLR